MTRRHRGDCLRVFVENSPEVRIGGDIAFGASGEPCWVEGTVTDSDGNRCLARG